MRLLSVLLHSYIYNIYTPVVYNECIMHPIRRSGNDHGSRCMHAFGISNLVHTTSHSHFYSSFELKRKIYLKHFRGNDILSYRYCTRHSSTHSGNDSSPSEHATIVCSDHHHRRRRLECYNNNTIAHSLRNKRYCRADEYIRERDEEEHEDSHVGPKGDTHG